MHETLIEKERQASRRAPIFPTALAFLALAACGYKSTCPAGERRCNQDSDCSADRCCLGAPSEGFAGICWPRSAFADGRCPATNACGGVTPLDHAPGESCEGTGACGPGVFECESSEAIRCSSDRGGSEYGGGPETCNELDDDCNGILDDVDEDGDGYFAASCGWDDCDDRNGSVYPWATETCGDGIDQDCNGTDVDCSLRFVEVGVPLGINDTHTGRGVAFVDFDGDDAPDIYVAGNGQDLFYLNEDGIFSPAREWLGEAEESGGRGLAAGDADNDGDPDLFVANWEDQQDFLYRNDGGFFTRIDELAGLQDSANGAGPAFADIDNDGDLDLFVANYLHQQDFLYRNDGGLFTRIDTSAGIIDEASGSAGLFTDYDGDGDPDLYVSNYFNEQDFLYRNDGGVFTRVDGDAGITDGSGGRGVAAGDYDNDGDIDLYVTNFNDQQDFLYRNDGGLFTRADGAAGIADESNGASALFFDYDNDGDLDLFVANYVEDQPDFLYENEGGFFARVESVVGLVDRMPSVGAACGDMDGDGDLDLYVVNFSNARDYLWRNDVHTGNGWIDVRPLLSLPGGASRYAIGAVVWVDFDGNGDFLPASAGGGGIFMQEAFSGATQGELVLHFGLGARPGPVAVKVLFPGPGTLAERTEILTGVEVDRRIDVLH
jgi:hypothetical protein